MGPEAGETRYAAPQFDNVNDYHGFNMAAGAVLDITGRMRQWTAIQPASRWRKRHSERVPASESLRITVTVTGPDGMPIVLDGYRTRYAPRSVP